MPFAGNNAATIHQMVEHRSEWDRESGGEASWMDGVSATEERALLEQMAPELAEEHEESAQKNLRCLTTDAIHLHEKVEILSRLVERLQDQVIALERRDDQSSANGEEYTQTRSRRRA